MAAAFPSHMAAVSGNGTAEGGLGKVAYGVGYLGGQALAGVRPRGGRISRKSVKGFSRMMVSPASGLCGHVRLPRGRFGVGIDA